MTEKKTIKGKVISGQGKAVEFTQLDWVVDQCRQKLGFAPFPGTLNLRVEGKYLGLLRELKQRAGIELCPPQAAHCTAKSFSVSLKGIRAAVVIPLVEHYPEDVLEIIAPVKLKEAFAVKDGDYLTIIIEQNDSTEGA